MKRHYSWHRTASRRKFGPGETPGGRGECFTMQEIAIIFASKAFFLYPEKFYIIAKYSPLFGGETPFSGPPQQHNIEIRWDGRFRKLRNALASYISFQLCITLVIFWVLIDESPRNKLNSNLGVIKLQWFFTDRVCQTSQTYIRVKLSSIVKTVILGHPGVILGHSRVILKTIRIIFDINIPLMNTAFKVSTRSSFG